MKNNLKIFITVVSIIIFSAFVYYYKIKSTPINQGTPVVTGDLIKGCYVGHLAKDVYTLNVLSQNGESFEGKLSFKNFEKDSSTGTYTGTYKNGILLGDYSFNSEGTNSVIQVIFKKSGNGFVRGYGDLTKDETHFADFNKITYDLSYEFEKSTDCASGFAVIYNNAEYGFTFSLPDDWSGYSIVNKTWNGSPITKNTTKQTGTTLLIRNPNWTSAVPYEDLPIMIFTLAQWNSYMAGNFAVSAAPILATELARNNSYVFALPPRWDFDYSKGYEESENIIKSNPLKTFEICSSCK